MSRLFLTGLLVHLSTSIFSQVVDLEQQLTSNANQENIARLHAIVKHYSIPDSSKAFSYSDRAIEMAEKLKDALTLAHTYLDRSYIYQENFSYEKAKYWQDRALKLFEKENDIRGIALINEAVGLAQVKQGYHNESLLLFSKALEGFKGVKDTTSILKSYYHLGYSHYRLRNYDSTVYYYFKVLPFCDEPPSDICIDVYNQLGATYTEIQEYEKASKYLKLSLDASLAKNDSRLAGIATMNIAGNYFFQQKLDSCAIYLNQAIELYEITGDKQGKVIGLNNLSIIYEENGELQKSLETAKASVAAAKIISDRNIIAGSYLQIMDLNVKLGQYAQALVYSDSALSLITELKSKYHFQQYYLSLSEAYVKQSDFKKAMEYKELYHAYSDSMVNEQKNKQIAEIETRYETEKKEQEIEILSTQNQLQAATIERNSLIIALVAVSFILGSGLLFIFFRQRNYKLKAQFESEKSALKSKQIQAVIETQESERKRFAMDLHDNFGQLISALRLITSQNKETKSSSDQLLDKMYASLKNIAFDLMPTTLVQKDLVAAIEELSTQINQSGVLAIEVKSFIQELPFSKEEEIGIYRIIQELTNNIIKYAKANKINVDFTQLDHSLQIIISDDGVGYDPNTFFVSSNNGWKNVSSRLELIHGELEIDSSPNSKGSTIILNIPLSQLTKAA